ncbi:Enterobactin exporter EntS [Andreprevotia sp. IGB-42]|uniref:enterobactin transporter EntS n=1 Tax=Andreprevotia sp. IGB-42 TaxID=2497473 RepID=UPI001359044A|nr:enterobactin transporter EntS [Andreprevotia sp. IGB-42]KAF0812629.1 Enterobactin exporter EntS [Andreprevotia sp. IGB-42]
MSERKSIFLDFSLLRQNRAFRAVFIARMLSVLGLGMMTVAVPIQIHALTGSAFQVGVAMALDGLGMFVGLMCGGVLADRFDRRKLILLARGLCGVGFLALALNAFLAAPSLLALYLISIWDGFFGAMGITALMASIPVLVGRENLPAAGALSMLIVRFGSVISPAIGGLVIASSDVSWNYLLAGIGTLATLIPLVRLPKLLPEGGEPEHPLRALADGVRFLVSHPIVGAVVVLGTLQTLLSAIRIIFPNLAENAWGGNAFHVGLMYSAVPLGAMIGAFTSGWVGRVGKPGMVMLLAVLASALTVASLGVVGHIVPGLLALAVLGYLGSIASLLQFTLVQTHTPDHLLGRVNSLWNAQDVVGDSVGTVLLGSVARWLLPAASVLAYGGAVALLAGALGLGFSSLRRLGNEPEGQDPRDEISPQPVTESGN